MRGSNVFQSKRIISIEGDSLSPEFEGDLLSTCALLEHGHIISSKDK
jgi:hypothetical protein